MFNSAAITFVNAAVIAPEGRIFDTIRIRRGRIDALGAPPSRRDTIIDLDHSVVMPGLINAHDHLELNSFKRLKWRDRYTNARQWIEDFQPRFASDPDLAHATPDTLRDRLWVGGLKNLLAGVTTVCHHNPMHRPLQQQFPVRVVKRFGLSHSLQIDGDRLSDSYRRTPADWPWIVHAAEGIDAVAASEVDALRERGCLGRNTVLVHGVAIMHETSEDLIARGVSLVWCPSSNEFLFGATAQVKCFHDAAKLALGTDSRLSGEGDLLDELRAARATRQLTPESLVRAVTDRAAGVLRLPAAGRLMEGAAADLTVVRRVAPDPYESIVTARRTDVRLTMIGGQSLVAEPRLVTAFDAVGDRPTTVTVDGRPRLMARWIAERAARSRFQEPGLEFDQC